MKLTPEQSALVEEHYDYAQYLFRRLMRQKGWHRDTVASDVLGEALCHTIQGYNPKLGYNIRRWIYYYLPLKIYGLLERKENRIPRAAYQAGARTMFMDLELNENRDIHPTYTDYYPSEDMTWLESIVGRLNAELLWRHYVLEQSQRHLAKVYRLADATISRHLSVAKKALRDELRYGTDG